MERGIYPAEAGLSAYESGQGRPGARAAALDIYQRGGLLLWKAGRAHQYQLIGAVAIAAGFCSWRL